MISKEERATAADLFEEVIEAWGRARKVIAPDRPRKAAMARQSPELGLSGTLLKELSKWGHDLYVNTFVGTFRDRQTNKQDDVLSEDVPDLPPEKYTGFVSLDDELLTVLDSSLRRLWNRATGHLDSQPRFVSPSAQLFLDIEHEVAQQKERLRRYTQPDPTRTRTTGQKPPQYVVVCEGNSYNLKSVGPGLKGPPKVSTKSISAKRLTGFVRTIMNFLEQEFFNVHGKRFRIRKRTDISGVLQSFPSLEPVVITYSDLYKLGQASTTKRVKGASAIPILSLTAKLPKASAHKWVI